MSASVEKPSPEMSGLLAANSGFALVEAAFIPASRRIGPASLWFIAVISLGALAGAAGITVTEASRPMMAVAELPPVPEPAPFAAAPSVSQALAAAPVSAPPKPMTPTEATPAPSKAARVLPVVLRGHPPSQTGHRS